MTGHNFDAAVDYMRSHGVKFEPGLGDNEIMRIEGEYRFRFPPDFRRFLQTALPVSGGFPNWRSESANDLRNRFLDRRSRGVLFDVEHNDFWSGEWGPRPAELAEALAEAGRRLTTILPLVPIRSHHYLLSDPSVEGNPVLSVRQTDIACVGRDLPSYRHVIDQVREETGHRSLQRAAANVPSVTGVLLMTDAAQLAGTDPAPLFAHLVADMSERKARLLRVALARGLWDEFTLPVLRDAVAVAERFADGEGDDEECVVHAGHVYRLLDYPLGEPPAPLVHFKLAINSLASSPLLLGRCGPNLPHETSVAGGGNWHAAMGYAPEAALAAIRDLFGGRGFDPRWRTETVSLLAHSIYRDSAFDRMPILADALEEAGCDWSEVLTHCRGTGFHARGCWVVDRLLGRE